MSRSQYVFFCWDTQIRVDLPASAPTVGDKSGRDRTPHVNTADSLAFQMIHTHIRYLQRTTVCNRCSSRGIRFSGALGIAACRSNAISHWHAGPCHLPWPLGLLDDYLRLEYALYFL